jgi:homocysteine S-methyltransferase
MRTPLDDFLGRQSVMVLDGALATELERRGADLVDPLWSAKVLVERPDLIRRVHWDYFNAGADVATTATYQATFEAFARRGWSRDAAANLMRSAVTLAIEARDEFWALPGNRTRRLKPLVAASIGPYGAFLADGSEYRGRYGLGESGLKEFHRPRLQVLAQAGADLLAFETIPCLSEALALAQLLTEFPSMSAWMSFSCQDGSRNCEGQSVAECAAALQPFAQIAAVGVNCTRPDYIAACLRLMGAHTDKPLLAYPNSGEQYDAVAKTWHGHTQGFAVQSRSWYEAGARLIGGCCRTTPGDIAMLRADYIG